MLQSEHGINIVGSSVGSRSWISAGADVPAQFGWAIARQKLMRMFSVIRDHDAGGFCWIGEASLIEDPILVTEMCRKGGMLRKQEKNWSRKISMKCYTFSEERCTVPDLLSEINLI